MHRLSHIVLAISVLGLTAVPSLAQDADELSKQLSNPVANLISVPFQNNFQWGGGTDDDAFSYTLNVQPVIPIQLGEWNLISRTILPIAYRNHVPGEDTVFGIGDISQSLFLSPAQPGPGGFIWGIGPIFEFPTASNDVLGTGKFSLGPTAIALVQREGWTFGTMANHVWSVAGAGDREDVSTTFLQPFISHALGGGRSISLNTESSYNWKSDQWTIPINLSFSQVKHFGNRPISFQIGATYFAEAPAGAPNWGIRAGVTFLFPKR